MHFFLGALRVKFVRNEKEEILPGAQGHDLQPHSSTRSQVDGHPKILSLTQYFGTPGARRGTWATELCEDIDAWLDDIGPLGTEPGPIIDEGMEPGPIIDEGMEPGPIPEEWENGEPDPGNELGRRDVSG